MAVSFQIESRPTGKLYVQGYNDSDSPDAADDLANRIIKVHREALHDLAEAWGFEQVESDDTAE